MDRPWAYADNVFLNVTDHNYELMFTISLFHVNALQLLATIPFFQERLTFYLPLHNAFTSDYNEWKQSGGQQKSDTLTVNQLLALRVQKLNAWEPRINVLFPKGSPGYVKLFPQGRYPFTTGKREQQIEAFNTLAGSLKGIKGLEDVQGEVAAYWEQLTEQHNTQQQSKGAKTSNSEDVEAARIAGCNGMFCNLGYTMAYYYQERSRIGNLFDVENIRHHDQLIFQRHVKPQQNLFVVKHKFAPGDVITCQNKGVTKLYLYEADSKTGAYVEGSGVLIMPGETATVEAGKLGAPDKAFLTVYNPDEINEAECEISFT